MVIRNWNVYIGVARVLQVLSLLVAVIGGPKTWVGAGVLIGLGTLIDLLYRLLEELRAQQTVMLGLIQRGKE